MLGKILHYTYFGNQPNPLLFNMNIVILYIENMR